MIKNLFAAVVGCFFTQLAWANAELSEAQRTEMLAMVKSINHAGLAYRAAVLQRMLSEANRAASRLKLPMKMPVEATDIQSEYIGAPWFRVLPGADRFPETIFGTHIFDPDIAREPRLRALKIGIGGRIDSAKFEFGFDRGKLVHIMRLSEPEVERYARNLDQLVGQPSLIDTAGAHQLATQWLAAVDVDMAALGKLKWTVNQLRYDPKLLSADEPPASIQGLFDSKDGHHIPYCEIRWKKEPKTIQEETNSDSLAFQINMAEKTVVGMSIISRKIWRADPKVDVVPELESDYRKRSQGRMFVRTNAPAHWPASSRAPQPALPSPTNSAISISTSPAVKPLEQAETNSP